MKGDERNLERIEGEDQDQCFFPFKNQPVAKKKEDG